MSVVLFSIGVEYIIMFPSSYTWTAVMSNVTTLLSEPVVATGTLFVIALPFVPRLVRTLRSAISGR